MLIKAAWRLRDASHSAMASEGTDQPLLKHVLLFQPQLRVGNEI